jgi:hypothetical protein
MSTITKKKAVKKLTGQALFDHRMAILNTKSKPLIIENGRNVWNIKPYKKAQ